MQVKNKGWASYPKIQDCIEYIKGCNFIYNGKVGRSYWFTKRNGLMPNGGRDVYFTLQEIKHCAKFGW
jgi:hypothetical protein